MTLTKNAVGAALTRLGHYRVCAAQYLALEGPADDISGSLLLALGLRESLLQNINNKAQTDKGCFQITERYHSEFLRNQVGCVEGTWVGVPGHSAMEDGYCPRFTPALIYALEMLKDHRSYAVIRLGLTGPTAVRFAIAAYNAGLGGALAGLDANNVDLKTTGGDYSRWVIEHRTVINSWLNDHPNWKITSLA